MGFLEDMKYIAAGKQAEEAAKMQQVASDAEVRGASKYAQGLAKMAAEQAYMNTTAPQQVQQQTQLQQPMQQGGQGFYGTDNSDSMSPQTRAWLQSIQSR